MKKKLIIFITLLSIFFTINAQELFKVSGLVVDSKRNDPIIGASIVEKGTSNGVITNANGEFTIKLKKDSKILVRFIGYSSTELTPKSGQNVIQLVEQSTNLKDVIVIGYGVQKKSDVTGAISSITAKDISSVPVSSPIQALQGKASGVQVIQNTGAPGAATTIKIRGTGTVNNSDPLYVVDGFIVEDISQINSGDIANIEILKDAASCSIYGARSANGVVLVSTKTGQSGKLKINFDTYSGISNPWKVIQVMNAGNFALMRDYVNGTNNYSADGKLYYSKNATTGELYYDDAKFQRIDSLKRNSPSSWWDAVTQTGLKQQYNISVSGGNEANKYMISANYYTEKGIVKTSDYDRFSSRINLSNKLAKWLTINSSLTYANENRDIVPEGQDGLLKKALYQSPLVFTYNTAGYFSEDHPIAMLNRNHNNSKADNLNINAELNAKINQSLTYQFKVSDISIFTNQKKFTEVQKLNENFVMPTDLTSIEKWNTTSNKIEINNILSYSLSKGKHDLNAIIGQTLELYTLNSEYAIKKGTSSNSDYLWYLSSGYTGDKVTETENDWSAIGYLGRINYAYDNKYLLQLNFRSDASSIFSSSNRWGYFPSFSVGWKFKNEDFLKDVDWLSTGKFRFGWGQLGNNRINEYARYTLVNNNYNYSYGAGNHILYPGTTSTTMGNDNIRWEKAESTNVGLDLGFLNNKLTTTFEYFNRLTSDMLLSVPVVLSAGLATAPMVNAGSVSNYGFEFNVNYKGSIHNFKYEIGFNASYIRNKVISLGSGNEPVYGAYLSETSIVAYVTKTEVGKPIGCFYGYVTDGIFNSTQEVAQSAQNDGVTKPGDFRFKDLNGDGKITAEDRTYLGSPHPDFVFGAPISISYKNIELSMFFQGQTGNKIFNVMEYYLNSAHGAWNVYSDLRNIQWAGTTIANRLFFPANPNGTVPDLDAADLPKNFRASNFYVKDGSYLRLKNVTINYNFPESICKSIKLENLTAYIGAYNLLTFTKYNGLDPEIGKNIGSEDNNLYLGVDHGNYPQARTFTIGIKLGL